MPNMTVMLVKKEVYIFLEGPKESPKEGPKESQEIQGDLGD